MAKQKSFLDYVEDRYGDDYFLDKTDENLGSIPTGSLALDVSIGIGGIPKGRFTEIYGPESVGKTTLALSIVKQAILSGHERVLYIETENNLNPRYVSSILGDLQSDKQVFIQPETAETAFDIALAGSKGDFDLVLFDSVGSLTPEKELKDDFTDQHIGLVPRIVSKFLRNANYNVRTKKIAFVLLNQIRANIGGYGHSYATPAGYALKHFTSVRVALTKGKAIEESKDGDKQIIGNIVNFTIKKNKVGTPFRSAFTNVIFGEGIDFYRDAINFGTLLGVIESRGSYLSFDGETISSKPGLANAVQALKESPETLDKLVNACYNTVGLNKVITSTDEDD